MASILRQIVAGPRARHPEAGLDLCYVTDFIIATSGPSSTYPKKAYRNPTDQLVKFLDYKHGKDWMVFEFRAEGTGYPDSEVYGRIRHYAWPDHHSPPMRLLINAVCSMRQYLRYEDENEEQPDKKKNKRKRVAVVHCKAGKGRSGTVACSYLISQEGWAREDALQRFTERRMRVGFGAGVSIPSQLRYVGYVDRWTNQLGKKYVERPVEIVEVHVWGLRDGVKVAVEGYVDDGRRIKCFHVFNRREKTVIDDGKSKSTESLPRIDSKKSVTENSSDPTLISPKVQSPTSSTPSFSTPPELPHTNTETSTPSSPVGTQTVLLRPSKPIIVPTSDVNIDFERRNRASYTGFTFVTSVAHVWFNSYFEGGSDGFDSGVFEIEWEAMDGIKGSVRKGTKAFDRMKVLWRYAKSPTEPAVEGEDRVGRVITEPGRGEPVPEGQAADWRGPQSAYEATTEPAGSTASEKASASALNAGAYLAGGAETLGKELGLRKEKSDSIDVSRASSIREAERKHQHQDDEEHHPYPSRSDQNRLEESSSPSPAQFGQGPKSSTIQSVIAQASSSEQQSTTTNSQPPPHGVEGKDRGHIPVEVQGPEGTELINYEDGESEEEDISPSNHVDPPSGISDIGLGRVSGVIGKLKEGFTGQTNNDDDGAIDEGKGKEEAASVRQ